MIILIGNVGSTSFKSKILEMKEGNQVKILGEANLDKIKSAGPSNFTHRVMDRPKKKEAVSISGLKDCIRFILDWYVDRNVIASWNDIQAMGFKCVMGIKNGANLLTPDILGEMEKFGFVAPAHNLPYLEAISEFKKVIDIPMVGVFEPSFHYSLPAYRKCLGIPWDWQSLGIKKLGFHGATHRYLSAAAYRLLGSRSGRIITVHLGGSSSICAVKDGKSVDIDQHFSPNSGLLQGTRIGDADATSILFAVKQLGISVDQAQHELSYNSGLKGTAGLGTDDFRAIEKAAKDGNQRARTALQLYVDLVRKHIGAFATVLGGVDCIAFGGGIGENNPAIREQCLQNMEFMGIHMNRAANRKAAGKTALISKDGPSRAKVYVIPTNEELVVGYFTKQVVRKGRDLTPDEMEFIL